ncbi:MAG: oligosaccharide flippase family protein [Candidatus Aminicenantes bacterium]|nr:oligosaccharide flippase family protein [Candidatus Aminicenantes bacterium]
MIKRLRSFLRHDDPDRIVRGGLSNLAGLVLRVLSGLGVYMLVSRAFSPAALGRFALLVACITVPAGISLLGMNHSLSRFVQEQLGRGSLAGACAVYRRMRSYALCSSLTVAALIFVNAGSVAGLFRNSGITPDQIRFAALVIPFFAFMTLNRGLLRAHHQNNAYAWFHFLPSLLCGLFLLATIAVGGKSANNSLPVQAYAAGVLIATLISVKLTHPYSTGGKTRDIPGIATVFRVSFSVFLLFIMHTLTPEMEILLLGYWVKDTTLAAYSLALRISAFAGFIHTALSVPLVPKIAEKHYQGRFTELEIMYGRTTRRMLALTLALGVGLIAGSPLILALFGKNYAIAWLPLVLLVTTHVVFAATGPVANYLIMTGHEHACTLILGFSLVLIMALQVMLIPVMGINGAALAHLAGFGIQRLLLEAYRRRIRPAG